MHQSNHACVSFCRPRRNVRRALRLVLYRLDRPLPPEPRDRTVAEIGVNESRWAEGATGQTPCAGFYIATLSLYSSHHASDDSRSKYKLLLLLTITHDPSKHEQARTVTNDTPPP
jgi:hypothetical protein